MRNQHAWAMLGLVGVILFGCVEPTDELTLDLMLALDQSKPEIHDGLISDQGDHNLELDQGEFDGRGDLDMSPDMSPDMSSDISLPLSSCHDRVDGEVILEGDWEDCQFLDQCTETGSRSRVDRICENGIEVEQILMDPCVRESVEGWTNCGEGRCTQLDIDPLHCGGCGIACPDHSRCVEGSCECDDHFTGASCDQCLEGFVGPNCDECRYGFGGEQCDEDLTPDYEAYERRPGVAFTPTPPSIPLPIDTCTEKPNQVIWSGRQLEVDCFIPQDTCVKIESGAEVICTTGMIIDGLVWMTSDLPETTTLLITDFIEVNPSGELYISGVSTERPFAQRAEVFLRHEYCGKPEDAFDAPFTAPSADDCRRKGKLQSFAGTVKIAGQPKTTWSLLTSDSAETHALTTGLIKVDHCHGWQVGDEVMVAATGGDQESYQGVHHWCTGDDCVAKQNSQSELRVIQTVVEHPDQTCDVILTQPLTVNHRGNIEGVATPFLRIQAEVVNLSRSVKITGGYQLNMADPNTRIATRYDYASAGTPSHTFPPNTEVTPCKVCKFPDDPSAGAHDLCTEVNACQVYDAEGESVQLCGQGCSPLGMQGITTVQRHGGVMQISHTSVEKCGRRELAEYCLHLHHVGDVRDSINAGLNTHESYLIGNAVREGINKGITIHGTHRALIQSNVISDQRGPGIYIEDGNELENVVEENVVLCSEVQANNHLCKLKNALNRHETTDSDWNEVSGIYFLAPMNHTIGNRVFGYDNAMYVNRNTAGGRGLGSARGKICTSSFPFGHTVGNVFHNNAGFGWYVNTAFPMNLVELGALELTSDGDQLKGTVLDWSKCFPFSLTGEDHSFNVKVQKHTEYFNDFSAGVYSVGDVTLQDYTNYGSNKGLYWKTYRRGVGSEPLCVNCTFINTSIEGPGGSGLVEFKDSHFYRRHQSYQVNHHCSLDGGTGGLCASHYDFRTSQFFEWSPLEEGYLPGNPRFYSGVYPTTTLIFTPDNLVLTHVTQNVGFNIQADPRCDSSTTYAGEGWYACENTAQDALGRPLELRIVRLYSPNRGILTVTNHSEGGLTYAIPWTNHGPQSGGANAYGVLPNCEGAECPNYMGVRGYVFSIPAQAEISLSFEVVLSDTNVLSDLFTLEYSEEQMTPITEITIRSIQGTGLMDSNQPCVISSNHSRALITPFGPVNGAAGAWYRECGHAWPLKHSLQELIDRSYQGEDAPSNGEGGTPPPVIDLEATPPTASPWSARTHPDPSQVLSLYSSIDDYQDVLSDAEQCRGTSPCAWPTWGAGQDQCTPCDITWIPGWSQQQSFEFEHQLPQGSTQLPSDKILRVETSTHWFTLFEMPPNATLNLTEYDVLHLEVWTPGVTQLSIKMRDFGPNQRWDADMDDIDGIKFFAFDDNLIPLQWSVLEVRLDELFPPGSARNIGYLVIDNLSPNLVGMPIYISNLYFFR